MLIDPFEIDLVFDTMHCGCECVKTYGLNFFSSKAEKWWRWTRECETNQEKHGFACDLSNFMSEECI